MYQNYYQQNQSPAANYPPFGIKIQQPMLKGRPVTSIEEVKASSVDFDGTVFYFPDVANKRIYTKQINLDGTATVLMYELKEVPVDQPVFVTREEFESAIKQIKGLLSQPVIQTDAPQLEAPQEFNF